MKIQHGESELKQLTDRRRDRGLQMGLALGLNVRGKVRIIVRIRVRLQEVACISVSEGFNCVKKPKL